MGFVYEIIDAIAMMIEVTMCFVFVCSFLQGKRMQNHKMGIIITNLLFVIINYITMKVEIFSPARYGLMIMVLIISQCLFYKEYCDKIAVMTITYMLFFVLIDCATVAIMTYLAGFEFSYFKQMTFFRIGGTFLSKSLLIGFVLILRKKSESLQIIKKKYLILLAIISGLIILFTFNMFQDFMARKYISASETSIFVLLMLIEFLLFFSFAAITESGAKEEKLALLDLHNQMLNQMLEEEKNSFSLWSGRIHDYKNQVLYMQELLKQKKYDQLRDLMEAETGILKKQCNYIKTGYTGIDAILNAKMLYAESQNIHIMANIKLTEGLEIDNEGIASVLGNLMDNAICEVQKLKERIIEIHIELRKNNMYLKIVNPKQNREIDFSKSKKKNSKFHGIGLQNVTKQVSQMGGDFKIIQEKDRVVALVVIYHVKQCIK